jgi:hypothetical protein
MYALSAHARCRIVERQVTDDELARALAGRCIEQDARRFHYDPVSRLLLVVKDQRIVTLYRMKPAQAKRTLSRL